MCIVLTAWQVRESRKTAHAVVLTAGHMLDFQILRADRVSFLQHLGQRKIDICIILWLNAVLATENVPGDSAGSNERSSAATTILTDNNGSCCSFICGTPDLTHSTVFHVRFDLYASMLANFVAVLIRQSLRPLQDFRYFARLAEELSLSCWDGFPSPSPFVSWWRRTVPASENSFWFGDPSLSPSCLGS